MRRLVDIVKHEWEPENLLDAIHGVAHLFRSRQFRDLGDAEHGITHMESRVLGFFARHPGATLSDLSAHSGRDKGQLARLVGALRQRGLISAHADESDRRNLHLQVTAEGKTAERVLRRRRRAIALKAVEGLTDAERVQLIELLQRIERNL